MGSILCKFRKKKTTKEQLETIEQKIRGIEKFQKETEQQFRRVVGKLLVSSILIYIGALIGFYYYYSPETFRDNIINFLPLLVFPILIIFFRKLLSWYYERKISKNESTLKTLKVDKKKILDEVMNTETYKVAKEILEKYAPDQLTREIKPVSYSPLRAIMPATTAKQEMSVRQRLITATPSDRAPEYSIHQSTVHPPLTLARPKLPLPRPVLTRDRGVFDRLVDFIVGDGPGNRYALICKICSSHNGMALKHEFEYLAFRCAYCTQWNPARKQKPQAPNLLSDGDFLDSSNENNSETDVIENESQLKPYENNADSLGTEKIEEEMNFIEEETEDREFSDERQARGSTNGKEQLPTESLDSTDLNDRDRVAEEVAAGLSDLLNSTALLADFPTSPVTQVVDESTKCAE